LLDTGFLVCEAEIPWVPMMDVVLRSTDWATGRTIWKDADNNTEDFHARFNRTRTWIAWTRGRTRGTDPQRSVALKRFDAGPDEAPRMIGSAYDSVIFCDWTPDDQLLVAIRTRKRWDLAIFSIDGRLVRRLRTPNGLCKHPHWGQNNRRPACWRHADGW
jgi:hypothetical protein